MLPATISPFLALYPFQWFGFMIIVSISLSLIITTALLKVISAFPGVWVDFNPILTAITGGSSSFLNFTNRGQLSPILTSLFQSSFLSSFSFWCY